MRSRLQYGEVKRLKAIVDALHCHRSGRRTEHLDPDQFESALEKWRWRRLAAEQLRKTDRRSRKVHLERGEKIVDVKDKANRSCGDALHQITEDMAERLNFGPTTFTVMVTLRPC